MTKVLAAIDGTAVSSSVLIVANEAARVLGAGTDAVYVADDDKTNEAAKYARAAGLTLRVLEGPDAETLVSEASDPDVTAVIVGVRRTVGGSRPAGHVALEVIRRAHTTVIAVPPATSPRYELRKVLVPIQGRPADAMERVVRLARDARLDLTVLHVHDERSIPSFEDRPHYDVEAWADEFLARWVPGARRDTVMEVRVGAPGEEIMRCAHDVGADVIAIGWSQDLSPGRATVVRAVLERSPVPVALLPLRIRDRAAT